MIDYIKAILKWIFREETLRNALFSVRIANSIYGKLGNKIPKKYGIEIQRKLKIAQGAMDVIQSELSNEVTSHWATKIVESKDSKTWGDFSAKMEPGRHGNGNDGVRLSLHGEVKGVPYKIGYSPDNGGIAAEAGLFSF